MIAMATPTLAPAGTEESTYSLIRQDHLPVLQALLANNSVAKTAFEEGRIREAFDLLGSDKSRLSAKVGLLKSEFLLRVLQTLPLDRGGI